MTGNGKVREGVVKEKLTEGKWKRKGKEGVVKRGAS